MSDHVESWSRSLFPLSFPSALMTTYLYSSKLKYKEKKFPLAFVFSGLSTSCSSVKKCIPRTGCNSLLSIKIILSLQSWSPYFPHLSSTLQNIFSFLCIDYFTNTANQRKHTSEQQLHHSHPGATFCKIWLPSNCISSKKNLNGHFSKGWFQNTFLLMQTNSPKHTETGGPWLSSSDSFTYPKILALSPKNSTFSFCLPSAEK